MATDVLDPETLDSKLADLADGSRQYGADEGDIDIGQIIDLVNDSGMTAEGPADNDRVQLGRGVQDPQPEPEPAKPETKAEEPEAAKAKEPEKPDEGNPEEAPVASADGKHTIPYAVLKAERDRARQAAERAEQLEQELEALRANAAKPESQREDVPTPVADKLAEEMGFTAEELAQASEYLPDEAAAFLGKLAKTTEAALARANALQEEIQRRDAEYEGARADQVRTSVQEDIDAVPDLASWQASDDERFDLAVRFDDALKLSPDWKDKPRVDRFREACRLAGGKELGATTPSADARGRSVDDAVRAASTATPTTLSDLPGGDPVAQSGAESIEGMSVTQLSASLMDKSTEEIAAYLARTVA